MINKLLDIINIVLVENDQKPLSSIKPSDRLRDDLDLDSFNLAYLTVLIENETGIDVFENGIVSTVEEILNQIEK